MNAPANHGRGAGIVSLVIFLVGVVSGGVAVSAAARKQHAPGGVASAVVAAATPRGSGGAVADIGEGRRTAIVQAAQKAGPSVVSISAQVVRTVRSNPFSDPFLDEFWGQFFPERRQVVPVLGSGFIIDAKQGYVVTNEHVVDQADKISVTLTDGRTFDAKLVGGDATYDLAVLQIKGNVSLPQAALGTADDLVVGEWAIAIGNPFGNLISDNQPTVTAGVISAVHRTVKSSGSQGIYKDMVQTDAAINPGNSGGPLVNADGEVIGVNTFIFTQSGGSVGIGFAIPIDRAKKVVSQLVTKGYVPTPWIGLSVRDLNNLEPLWVQRLGLKDTEGLLITTIEDGSPADKAGLLPGDVIRGINGKKVTTSEEARQAFFDAEINSTMTLGIEREGKKLERRMVLTEAAHK